jgi:hypothetical protein
LVLRYERDIEPLPSVADLPQHAIEVGTTPQNGAPPIDAAFRMITECLQERSPNDAFPLTQLGHWLKQHYGLVSATWYGIPLKSLLLQAQAAGEVRLSTRGGFDYVELATRPAPTAEPSEERIPAEEYDGGAESVDDSREKATIPLVQADWLANDELSAFVRFFRELAQRSRYITFKYLVDNLEYHSVMPRLSRHQIEEFVTDLRNRGVLTRTREIGVDRENLPYSFWVLVLNEQHDLLQGMTIASAAK